MAVRSSSMGDIADCPDGTGDMKQDPDDIISESSQKTTQTDSPQRDVKRRRFRPLKVLRRIFFGRYRNKRDSADDPVLTSAKKSKNGEKILPKKKERSSGKKTQDKGKAKDGSNTESSRDSKQQFKNQLETRLMKNHDLGNSDEGLSRSFGDSASRTSTGERGQGRMKRDSGADSGASLLSIYSDDEMLQSFFGSSFGERTLPHAEPTTKADLEFVSNSSSMMLGNDAARHKRAVAPKQRRAKRTRIQRAPSRTSDLPSTCEVSEDDARASSRPFDLQLSSLGIEPSNLSISPLFSPSEVAKFGDFADLESTINKELLKLKLMEKDGGSSSSCVKVEVHSSHTTSTTTGRGQATAHTEDYSLKTCDITGDDGSVVRTSRDETHGVSDRHGDGPEVSTVSSSHTSNLDKNEISQIEIDTGGPSAIPPMTSTPVKRTPSAAPVATKKLGFIRRIGLNIGKSWNKSDSSEDLSSSSSTPPSSPWKKPLRRTIGSTAKNDKPSPISKTQKHSSCENLILPSPLPTTTTTTTPQDPPPPFVAPIHDDVTHPHPPTAPPKLQVTGQGAAKFRLKRDDAVDDTSEVVVDPSTMKTPPAPRKPSPPPKPGRHAFSKSSSQLCEADPTEPPSKPMFPIRKIQRPERKAARSPSHEPPTTPTSPTSNKGSIIEMKIKSRSLERGATAAVHEVPSWVALANARREQRSLDATDDIDN